MAASSWKSEARALCSCCEDGQVTAFRADVGSSPETLTVLWGCVECGRVWKPGDASLRRLLSSGRRALEMPSPHDWDWRVCGFCGCGMPDVGNACGVCAEQWYPHDVVMDAIQPEGEDLDEWASTVHDRVESLVARAVGELTFRRDAVNYLRFRSAMSAATVHGEARASVLASVCRSLKAYVDDATALARMAGEQRGRQALAEVA